MYYVDYAYDYLGERSINVGRIPHMLLSAAIKYGEQIAQDLQSFSGLSVHVVDAQGNFITAIEE